MNEVYIMLKNILIYLFGEKIGERLSSDEFVYYYVVSSLLEMDKIIEKIKSLASYTRDKEREIYHLATLPDISEDYPLDSKASKSIEQLQDIEKLLKKIQNELDDSLPKLKLTVNGRTSYYQAQQEAVECHVLEEIREMHCASCKRIIQKYTDNGQITKAQSFKTTLNNLINEYNAKIQLKRDDFSLHIEDYMKQANKLVQGNIITRAAKTYLRPEGLAIAGAVKVKKASGKKIHYRIMIKDPYADLSIAHKLDAICERKIVDKPIRPMQGQAAGDAILLPNPKGLSDKESVNHLLILKSKA